MGQFFQGFVPAWLAREILIGKTSVNGDLWRSIITVSICLAFNAFYEFIEWAVALGNGKDAEAFLGTQGDIWGAQPDMGLALYGAVFSLLMLSASHNRQLKDVTQQETMVAH